MVAWLVKPGVDTWGSGCRVAYLAQLVLEHIAPGKVLTGNAPLGNGAGGAQVLQGGKNLSRELKLLQSLRVRLRIGSDFKVYSTAVVDGLPDDLGECHQQYSSACFLPAIAGMDRDPSNRMQNLF